MTSIIDQLKQKQWLSQGGHCIEGTENAAFQDTGYRRLNRALRGGWPLNGIVQMCSPLAIGEMRLLSPALTHCEQGYNVLINPPGCLSGVFLSNLGVNLDRVLVLHPKSHKDMLWAMENCLKSGVCRNVLAWPENNIEIAQSKRLKLASEKGESRCFLMMHKAPEIPLPVDLGITLQPNALGLDIRIHKRKQGFPSEPFFLDMSEHWPRLAIEKPTDNVVHLHHHRHNGRAYAS